MENGYQAFKTGNFAKPRETLTKMLFFFIMGCLFQLLKQAAWESAVAAHFLKALESSYPYLLPSPKLLVLKASECLEGILWGLLKYRLLPSSQRFRFNGQGDIQVPISLTGFQTWLVCYPGLGSARSDPLHYRRQHMLEIIWNQHLHLSVCWGHCLIILYGACVLPHFCIWCNVSIVTSMCLTEVAVC